MDRTEFERNGFILVRDCVPGAAIDRLMRRFLDLVEERSGRRFDDPHGREIADFLGNNRAVQARVYDDIRGPDWLVELSLDARLIHAVNTILGTTDVALQRKIPFRIDTPLETSELAVWHQDHWYVRGNTQVVTAWLPMQDTDLFRGCLSVMPGSHRLGPLDHDVVVLGKRHAPRGIYDREVRYVEMRKGDALLFHSLLLHSSNLNFSESIRYSVQPRYSPAHLPTDPNMGNRIAASPRAARNADEKP